MSLEEINKIVVFIFTVTNLVALGICSRNGGAMFVAFAAFPIQDPNVLVMILLAVPVPILVWMILARYFASRADKLVAA